VKKTGTFVSYCFYGVPIKPAEGLMGDLEKLSKNPKCNHAIPCFSLKFTASLSDTLKIIKAS